MKKTVVKPPQIVMDWKKWLGNIVEYSAPIFLGTFFAQLALGVTWEKALPVSLITLYGALRDYFNKRSTVV